MSDLLEIQKLRIQVFNEIIKLRNPSTSRFKGDSSRIDGQLSAYKAILEKIDIILQKHSL